MQNSQRCLQGRCTGRRFFLLPRLRCASRWVKWPTRCCCPASASCHRRLKNLAIDFCTPICSPHLRVWYRQSKTRQESLHGREADINLEHLPANVICGHGALDGLSLAQLQVELRLKSADDRLLKMTAESFRCGAIRFRHRDGNAAFHPRTLDLHIEQ